MSGFERAFDETQNAAAATLASAGELIKLARQLEKASREGNIAAIKRLQDRLDTALGSLGQAVTNAVQSRPFEEDEEEQYLKDGYRGGVCGRIASEKGLDIHERDDRLVSHPSIVRVLPAERAVRIDKKKVSSIRPSHLADALLKNQEKPGRYQSGAFLDSLYNVYSDIVRDELSDRDLLAQRAGRVVPWRGYTGYSPPCRAVAGSMTAPTSRGTSISWTRKAPSARKRAPASHSRHPRGPGVRRACSPSSDRMAATWSITDSGLPRAADVEHHRSARLAPETRRRVSV